MSYPGERHTRQGRARGQAHGTLDRSSEGEPYDARKDYGSHEATNLRERSAQPRPPRLPELGWQGGCWCGKPQDHGWWGMDEGVPHPREDQPQ